MPQRVRKQTSGEGLRRALQLSRGADRDDLSTARACTGAEIDHVIGAPDRVLVVLDHQQRITLRRQARERIEQDAVVARMQTDRGLIEDVAHAL